MPIIEIPPIGWDFELGEYSKTLQEHLQCQPKRFIDKWPELPFYLDCNALEKYGPFANAKNPLRWLLEKLSEKGQKPVPVLRIESSEAILETSKWFFSIQKKLCIRVGILSLPNTDRISRILEYIGANPEEVDFIFDYGAPSFQQKEMFENLIRAIVPSLPFWGKWRKFILLGCSFPQTMGSCSKGLTVLPREEWLLWRKLKTGGVISDSLLFADYCISHPETPQGDMRMLKPSASVRYTCSDAWVITKGVSFRKDRSQYRRLCGDLINSGYFEAGNISAGSRYIENCARGIAGTGNLSTWRWVGTNHHIEKVAGDVASFLAR